jgi:hypothetical protein
VAVLVDVRANKKLRGPDAVDLTGSLGPIIEALLEDSVDLSRLRLTCDWVQYGSNFREVIAIRPILSSSTAPDSAEGAVVSGSDIEIAVDLRRCGDVALKELARAALDGYTKPAGVPRAHLEAWTPTSASCLWRFNSLYWRALDLWEQTTGRKYEQALPGGESDARNKDAVRELILDMFRLWDDLGARNSLPDELYVIELGVGNGNQARTWMDEFVILDRAHGKDYYRRLHYLMCDYSPHVLKLARKTVADHLARVSSFVLDATEPTTALGFLRYKVFLVYISNVYDNLPTEEVARIGGRNYRAEVRAYLPEAAAKLIGAEVSATGEAVPDLVGKLLSLGPALLAEALPAHFPNVAAAVRFWQRAWEAVKLEERYVPLTGLDLYEIAPRVSGEMLRPLMEAGGDIRMHVSNGAVASFVDTLPLLHPYGRLQCHDLFVTDVHQYQTGFRGPGKYDGSVVNWVNGPLLQHIGSRKGFDVSYAPFRHRIGTNIVTLTARVRD